MKTIADTIFLWAVAAIITNVFSGENIMFKWDTPGIGLFCVCYLFMYVANKQYDDDLERHVRSQTPSYKNKRSRPSFHIKEEEEEEEENFVNPYASTNTMKSRPKEEDHSYYEQQKKAQEQEEKKAQQKHQQQQRKQTKQQQKTRQEQRKINQTEKEFNNALTLFALQKPFTRNDVNARYKELMLGAHPDLGGKHDDAIKINTARDALLKHLDKEG